MIVLGQNLRLSVLTRISPRNTNWSGQASALSDRLLDIPTILTYLLIA
jgi:hypothetical protein